jgi:hypothetical protein
MRAILQDELPHSNTDLTKKAVTKQQNFEEMKTLQSYYSGKTAQKNTQKRRTRFTPRNDPDAMDVDRMSDDERNECFKKGLCFICKKTGHRSNDRKYHPRGDAGKKKTISNGKKPVRREITSDDEEADETGEDEETELRRADF